MGAMNKLIKLCLIALVLFTAVSSNVAVANTTGKSDVYAEPSPAP